ncbi:MAG TPA: TIGR01777 family oxidoreductase [Syntrophales bacterium]|jgi:hypothetical protein|nr:TIGR01777 family oxidoreductase [Syntrophales bacterium]HOU76908.1 TIGR01777 family oxidoreductase [Syntrophales bacterium]HPC31677.1 TIGR01777 family oxidoreductase [Syntrophales bacterium]HQG34268.1 TIGR01777 family oxidoreductase [Syntrophales bacterium]HRR46395.1 TIGR01777 family oxidoreductase [Syntrophales bacterium]
MKVFMTGGTGFVGATLTRSLLEDGHEVRILTRPGESRRTIPAGAEVVVGDPVVRGLWQDRVSDHDVIINLAGASIFSRWNDTVKKQLRSSRILTTRHLVEALGRNDGGGKHLLSASAVGYYGFHDEEILTEDEPPGKDFLAALAADWEREALAAQGLGVRTVTCRFGIVLGRNGGALGQMLPLFKFWAGSPLGSGKQWFSWIHERDLAEIFLFLIRHTEIAGPVNCTAPEAVTNEVFTRVLGEVLQVPTFLPAVPGFMMKLVLGEFGDVLLQGQRVFPQKLQAAGYSFLFPTLREALTELLSN